MPDVQPRGRTGFISRYGRPPRTATLRELALGADHIEDRINLINVAYREALDGGATGARWADWLARITGELSQVQVNVMSDSPMMAAIAGMRDALGLPPLGAPQAIDAEARVVETTNSDDTTAQ